MEKKNDAYYIEKVKQGDRSAFSFIVTQYQDLVFSLALQMLKNSDDAEDMAQEIFIKVYKSLNQFKGTSKFSTWLYRISYNMIISSLRKKNKIQVTDEDSQLERNSDAVLQETDKLEEDMDVTFLQSAIQTLEDEERVLITLHYFKEQSVEDMAKITGLSLSNVKVKLFRIRKKMKGHIENEKKVYFKEL